MADKLDVIGVKGTKNDSKVVLFERHPDHPNGEVVVVNDGKTYKVAETAAVKRLIGQGDLERVNLNSAPSKTSEPEKDKKPAPPKSEPKTSGG